MSDTDIRAAAFAWLGDQVSRHEDVLPWKLLADGFAFHGERVPLVSQQGIFKPRIMELPLTIRTTANGPYADTFGSEFLHYKYRGADPNHRDNVGLVSLMTRGIPLIYFHALVPGKYLAVWPVFVVGADAANLTFTVAVDDRFFLTRLPLVDSTGVASDAETPIRRSYLTVAAKQRIHQRAFRERVIDAYRRQCALCRLKHHELLDAAHIVPDSDPEGEPRVSNGISLCKLHHAAFDKYFISVRPDYVIEVRRDVLIEEDGPMLRHGLQGMHEQRIQVPGRLNQRPDREFLDRRHRRFLELAAD